MISPMRYEVEIQAPLSVPVPMPPSMSSSEALVIWMFRIAMNAPIMPAPTATHEVRLAPSPEPAARASEATPGSSITSGMYDMVVPPAGGAEPRSTLDVGRRRGPRPVRLGVDRRVDGHARAQHAGQRARGIDDNLDRDALDDLGEVAGRVVGRQQREGLAARRRQAVDTARDDDAREHVDLDRDRLAGPDVGEL